MGRPNQPVAIEALESRTLLAATLVKDINTTESRPALVPQFEFNGSLICTAVGAEGLWRTDTTPGGTVNLGGRSPNNVTRAGPRIFFIDDTTLWTSDGTEAGTIPLKRLAEYRFNSFEMFASGEAVYVGGQADGLWRSDGTVAGTVRLGTVPQAERFAELNGRVLFTDDVSGQTKLYRTDGTDAGTVQVKDVDVVSRLIQFGRDRYFLASDGLWRTNGTSRGTQRVKSIPSEWIQSVGNELGAAGSRLYFFTNMPFNSSGHTYLWISDGTAAGTTTLKDFTGIGGASSYSNFLPFGRRILFTINVPGLSYEPSYLGKEWLWRSDGTAAGTVAVKELGQSGVTISSRGISAGSSLYFTAYYVPSYQTLWKTNGTSKGTRQLSLQHYPYSSPVALESHFYFVGATEPYQLDTQLFKFDPVTEASTMMNLLEAGTDSSNPRRFYGAGGSRYFEASGELWRTNGTLATTTKVPLDPILPSHYGPATLNGVEYWLYEGRTNVPAGLYKRTSTGTVLVKEGGFHGASALITAGSKLYFTAPDLDGSTGVGQLWASDGTAAGTQPVEGLNFVRTTVRRFSSGFEERDIFVLDGRLHFYASHKGLLALWVSDGTFAGSARLKDLTTLGRNVTVGPKIGKHHLLSIDDRTIWKTDGTASGTQLLKDDMLIQEFAALGSNVVFSDSGALWTTDGTADGTRLLIGFGDYTVSLQELTAVGSKVYFTVAAKRRGTELWQTDGTVAGTTLVKDIRVGSEGSAPAHLAAAKGKLYFSADDGIHGRELWRSDGTAAGTVLVADVEAGLASSNPGNLTPLNNLLLFSAYTSAYGTELWKLDI